MKPQMKTMAKAVRKATLLSTTAALGGAIGLFPTVTSANEDGIEEITVTATRRATSVQDVPYNITALGGKELEDRGIVDAAELFRAVPGSSYVGMGSRNTINNSTIVLRGINLETAARVASAFQTAPVVSTYINETPVNANFRLKDIERVEILRGPQGTLYGSGALGGSVRYIYNKPKLGEKTLDVSAGFGNTESSDSVNYEVDVIGNMPLGEDAALRVYAGYVDNAGFIDKRGQYLQNPDGRPVLDNGSTDPIGDAANFTAGGPVIVDEDDVNDSTSYALRAEILFAPNDDFEISALFHYQDSESDDGPFTSPGVFGDDSLTDAHRVKQPSESETWLAAIEAEYDMGFATLVGSVSHYDTEGSAGYDATGLSESFFFYSTAYGSSPRFLNEGFNTFESDSTTVEARLVSDTDGVFDWVLGLYYQDHETTDTEDSFAFGYHDYSTACFISTGTFGGVPCGFGTFFGFPGVNTRKDLSFLLNQTNDFKDFAVFGELTYHINDSWDVTGGFRYFDQKLTHGHETGLIFVNPVPDVFENTRKDDDVLFKVNTSYALNDNTNLYFVWSEGFRRGGANGLPSALVTNQSSLTYEPDKMENIEAGVKGSLLDRFQYTLSYFNMDWKKAQVNAICTPFALTCVMNLGKAESQGVEFDIKGNITDNIDVIFAYTYLDAEVKEILPAASADLTAGFAAFEEGRELSGAPENTLYMGARYVYPVSGNMDLMLNVNGAFRDETESDTVANSVRVDSFWTWDASAALSADRWTVSAYIDNIGDERGIVARLSPQNYGPRSLGVISNPRTFGVNVRYSFGD